MPAYTFFCDSCQKRFEIICSIKEYTDKKPCEFCNSKKSTYRLYVEDLASLNTSVNKADNELKTVGDLAKRNTDRMSDDEKNHLKNKHNSYKENKPDDPLPSGMSRMNRPKTKTKWT